MTPQTVARLAPLSMEFSRRAYWSRLPFPSSGRLPDPGIEPGSAALQVNSLPYEPSGKPPFPNLLSILSASPKMSPHVQVSCIHVSVTPPSSRCSPPYLAPQQPPHCGSATSWWQSESKTAPCSQPRWHSDGSCKTKVPVPRACGNAGQK